MATKIQFNSFKSFIPEMLNILNFFKNKYGTDVSIKSGYDEIRNVYYAIISDKTSSLYLNPKFSINTQYFEFAHILYDMANYIVSDNESSPSYTSDIEDWIDMISNLKEDNKNVSNT